MINPTEYSNLLDRVRLSLCDYSDKYANLHDYGIQTHKDKIKLIIVYHYYEYLAKVADIMNPIDSNNKIKLNTGQLPEMDDDLGYLIAVKEYNETTILKCLKRINQILKTGHVIKIYTDSYYNYST